MAAFTRAGARFGLRPDAVAALARVYAPVGLDLGADTPDEIALMPPEARLHEAAADRRSLVEAQSRFIPAELLRILDVDDIRRVRRGLRVERELTVLISDIRGWTALLEAVILGDGGPAHQDIGRLLIDAGADVDLPDYDGVTPLAHARRAGYEAISRMLERAGARA